MAPESRDGGAPVAGAKLLRARLALRGRKRPPRRKGERPHHKKPEKTLQHHDGRLARALREMGAGRAVPEARGRRGLRLAEEPALLPPRAGLQDARQEPRRLHGVQEGRKRGLDGLPHQVQRPHQAERGIRRIQHQGGGELAPRHAPVQPQQGILRPDILRHRQPLPFAQGHRQGKGELHPRRGEIDAQRHRQGSGQPCPRQHLLRRARLRQGAAVLFGGRAAAQRQVPSRSVPTCSTSLPPTPAT